MINCTRCCLNKSMRTVNVVVHFCGIAMIIYSLWLLKKWREGVDELVSASAFPKPWFIYTCLGMGIVVCMSMLSGHMVANRIRISILSMYIVFVFSILLLQTGAIIAIFFKMDWETKMFKYIDSEHEKFEIFLSFHLSVCRFTAITILVAQISAVMVAVALWTMGPEPRSHCRSLEPATVRQSFLVGPNSPVSLNERDQFEES